MFTSCICQVFVQHCGVVFIFHGEQQWSSSHAMKYDDIKHRSLVRYRMLIVNKLFIYLYVWLSTQESRVWIPRYSFCDNYSPKDFTGGDFRFTLCPSFFYFGNLDPAITHKVFKLDIWLHKWIFCNLEIMQVFTFDKPKILVAREIKLKIWENIFALMTCSVW